MKKKIKKEELKENYMTIPDAVVETGCDYKRIYGYYQRNRIRSIRLEGKQPLVNIIDLKRYLAAHPTIEKDVVWDNIRPLKNEGFYPVTGYDFRYFGTDKGRFFNLTTGEELINNPRESDGYIQLTLIKDGKQVYEYLHRLILAAICPVNDGVEYATTAEMLEKTRYEGHHIKIGKAGKSINKPEFLLWANPDIKYYVGEKELTEHQKLHQLWDDGMKKEYRQMVKKIKKENERKLYKIPHPDYESDNQFSYYLLVDEKGYRAYKRGNDVPLTSIFNESAESRAKVDDTEK